MAIPSFLRRQADKKVPFKSKERADFVSLLQNERTYYAECEKELTNKPINEILLEIDTGLKIFKANLESTFETFENRSIILVPPKYEFWSYLLLGLSFSKMGYRTQFLYHNWSNQLIELIKPNLEYLEYQNLVFINAEDFNLKKNKKSEVFNFSESVKGLRSTIPSFSTAIVTSSSDIDYALAYVFANAFAFAGLKKSNLKRIIVDTSIKEEFRLKLESRLTGLDAFNSSRIRSKKIRKDIHELISDGISDGANLIVGESDFESDSYSNVILTDVVRESRIYQKKFFGPVLLVSFVDFSDKEELEGYLLQQPASGVVVFDESFSIETVEISKKITFVHRPLPSDTLYLEIIEDNPSLELLLLRLRKE